MAGTSNKSKHLVGLVYNCHGRMPTNRFDSVSKRETESAKEKEGKIEKQNEGRRKRGTIRENRTKRRWNKKERKRERKRERGKRRKAKRVR